MPEDKDSGIVSGRGGIFNNLALRIKLVIRLIGDARVNPLLKLLPIGSLMYLIIPDLAIGPIDDVAVIWLGSYLFIELCPPYVVAEHTKALEAEADVRREPNKPADEVIEGEFWEEKDH